MDKLKILEKTLKDLKRSLKVPLDRIERFEEQIRKIKEQENDQKNLK